MIKANRVALGGEPAANSAPPANAGTTTVAPVAPRADLSSGARGKQYWIGYCQSCHGNDYAVGRSTAATLSQIAANRGQLAVVKELVAHKPNLDYQHEMTKNTALHLAAMNGYKDVVEYLVSAGANPNLKMKGDVSIVRVVRDMGNTEMVDLLLKLGAKDDGCEGECF